MLSSRSIRVSKTSRSTLLPSLSPSTIHTAGRLGCSEQIRNFRFDLWSYLNHDHDKRKSRRLQYLKSRHDKNFDLRAFLENESNKRFDGMEQYRKLKENLLKESGTILDGKISRENIIQWANICDRAVLNRLDPKTFARQYASTQANGSNDDGFVIDPITNRKVPKKSSNKPDEAQPIPDDKTQNSAEIPVKTFKEDRKRYQPSTSLKDDTDANQIPSPKQNSIIEDSDAYNTPFYVESSQFNSKQDPKPEQKANDGIKHRTEADERCLMEYEERCKVDYNKPYLYDEPEEWYPRQLTEDDTAIKRAKLDEDFQKAGEIIKRDQQILDKELEQSRLVADERRTREIHRNAEEIHTRNVANEKDVEEQRRVREINRKAGEIHARFVNNEKQIEEDRKAREINRKADEIHAQFLANEKQIEEEKKTREIKRNADEIHARFVANEKQIEEDRKNRDVIREAEELHTQFLVKEKQVEQDKKNREIARKAEELHAQFVAKENAVKEAKKIQDIRENAEGLHDRFLATRKVLSEAKQARDIRQKAEDIHNRFVANESAVDEVKRAQNIQQNADEISSRRAANQKVYDESVEEHRKSDRLNQMANAESPRLSDLKIENSELRNHVAHLTGRVDKEIANIDATISVTKSKPKMTGNFARDFPEESNDSWKSNEEFTQGLTRRPQNNTESQSLQSDFAIGRGSKEAFSRDSSTPRLQTSIDRTGPSFHLPKVDPVEKAKTDAILRKLQEENDPYSKEPMGLELSYRKECAIYGICNLPLHVKSYGTSKTQDSQKEDSTSAEKSTSDTNVEESSGSNEGSKAENSEMTKSPQKPIVKTVKVIKPEPKTDSEPVSEEGTDAFGYSKKPMGLELSYKQECEREGKPIGEVVCIEYGSPKSKQEPKNAPLEKDKQLVQEVRAAYEDSYGTIDDKHRQVPVTDNKGSEEMNKQENAAQEPNQYKILAYDPTMQSVSTADATSIVVDTASALTPAEVLLRLSNPAKFFPHFGPLQAQGYEIVSGSGDVLVFRKVRAAAPEISKVDQTKKVVNPIDGMESRPMAATGNFASPTGFVNHDIPVNPPFKSNIDVRREEPVFSGTKSTWADEERDSKRKRGGRGKRLLIGAFSFGACSYAIGVVSEFFRTGGSDGLGPVGF